MVVKGYEGSAVSRYVSAYLDNMAAAYAIADLVLARAGGTTIAELTAVGLPSVLIPLPTAAEDHQRLNAEALEAHGAAICLAQDSLTPDALWETLSGLLFENGRLEGMKRCALSLRRLDAADRVVETILKVAGGTTERGENVLER